MTAVRDAPSAAIEPLPRFLHLCYLGLAFFWACSMLTFRSSILLTGAADTPQYNTLIVVVSFLANMTVLLGVSALVERAPENLAKLSPWPFCGCILAGIAAIGGAGIWFAGPALSASLVIGSTLCGIGFGYLWGSWADVLGRVHPSRTALYAPASFLLTTIIFLAVDSLVALTPFPPLALMAPLPIASVLCLKRCRTESSQSSVLLAPHRTESQRYLAALTTLVPLIIAALVFSCLFGFMWEAAVLSVNSASTAHELPLVLNFVVAVLLLAFTVALQRRVNLSLVYQLLIPIAIVLFTALPFFFFALYEKNGQTPEKMLKNYFSVRFLTQQARPYRTENRFAALERQAYFDEEVKQLVSITEKAGAETGRGLGRRVDHPSGHAVKCRTEKAARKGNQAGKTRR